MSKKNTKIITVAIVAIIVAAGAFMLIPQNNNSDDKETIVINGSTTVSPIMLAVKPVYENGHNAVLNITPTGSGNGASSTLNGSADLGMLSRDLKQSEKDAGLVEKVIGIDGIAVILNSSVTGITDLTTQQLADIYSGKITNWNDVGGPNMKINVLSREDGSGTRDGFESALSKADPDFEVTVNKSELSSTGAVMTKVDSTKGTIGYVSVGYTAKAGANTHVLSVNGVEPTVDNIVDGSYKMQRNLLLVTKGAPQGAALELINWILSEEGQKIVESEHYVPVA